MGRGCLFIAIGQHDDRKQRRERGMGSGKVCKPGLYLRTPKAAICRRAAHEAIGGNMNIFYMFWLLFYTLFKLNFVEFIKEKV